MKKLICSVNNDLQIRSNQFELNIDELHKVLESEYMSQSQITTKLNSDIVSLN